MMTASQHSLLPEDTNRSRLISTLFIYISNETQPSVAKREDIVGLETNQICKKSNFLKARGLLFFLLLFDKSPKMTLINQENGGEGIVFPDHVLASLS